MQTTTLCTKQQKKKLHSTAQLLHNYDYYVLKILQISETWGWKKKLLSQKWSLNFLLLHYLQMIILFLKMATFGWNNEWGIATA